MISRMSHDMIWLKTSFVWVMSHTWIRHGTHHVPNMTSRNESWHELSHVAHICMNDSWMSHVAHTWINESCHTHMNEWVITWIESWLRFYESCRTHMDESCRKHVNECVMSHAYGWMSHGWVMSHTYMNEWVMNESCCTHMYEWLMNESCHTHMDEWVTNESCCTHIMSHFAHTCHTYACRTHKCSSNVAYIFVRVILHTFECDMLHTCKRVVARAACCRVAKTHRMAYEVATVSRID